MSALFADMTGCKITGWSKRLASFMPGVLLKLWWQRLLVPQRSWQAPMEVPHGWGKPLRPIQRSKKWEQSGTKNPKAGTKWGQESQSGNKRGTKWDQEFHSGNKRGTKWDQESQSGNKKGTKWEQSETKNPKVGTREEQSGNKNPNLGTREELSGNKVGPRIQKWEQERNKVGTKCKSGYKRGTKWEQSGQIGNKNLKVGTREEQSGNKVGPRIPKWDQERNKVGTKWDQEPQSGNKRGTKWEQSGAKNPKVGTREEQSGTKNPKVGTREEQSGNKVGPTIQFLEFGQSKHCIPIKKQCLYLGTVLSYDDFQKQTVALRVQAGWKNFRRLQPWLCKRHKIPLQMRVHLFNTCIIPTICYGIFFTGMTSTGIELIIKTLNMMYRRVLWHVPHLARVKTDMIFELTKFDIPSKFCRNWWSRHIKGWVMH